MNAQLARRMAALFFCIGHCGPVLVAAQENAAAPERDRLSAQGQVLDRKAQYVSAVTRGAGFVPRQEQERISDRERVFREAIERRKDDVLAARIEVTHPVLLKNEDIEQARRNIEAADWARKWYRHHQELADYVVDQPDDYVDKMVPELTPTNPYGFTCPHCVGRKSQEAVGISLMAWDYRDPDVCSCRSCGQVYPSEQYPETARLVCPRSEQVFTYYLNDQEREHPDDRSGKYAWHWVGRPIHVSFTGVIREKKIIFMINAGKSLALASRFTQDPRYGRRAIRILVRLAHCYRNWLYHDYWDTIADCDPIYAAYHDKSLALEWKRHLCADAYKNDKPDRAAMLRNYWGAGRIHPSCDVVSNLATIALAYDLVYDARDRDGQSLWSPDDRARVERDLILEYAFGAEPFVGGPGQATNVNNKAPRVYRPQAVVAQCLGLTDLADTALRGYEAVRDKSFLYDGFSHESPAYNNAYLSEVVPIPEQLHGFRWPDGFGPRQGVVDCYRTDPGLRLMFRAMIDQLRPDGRYPPLADTMVDAAPSPHLIELGQKRYAEYFDGTLPTIYRKRSPTEYAVFHLDSDRISRDTGLVLPEMCFPVWRTAILRHGQGPEAAMLTLTFSPWGPHRHYDNLALFYAADGRTMLGDQGYVCDMPVNSWIHSTLSHNLVVVDNAEQRRGGRRPRLHRFVATPRVSVVEASSEVYDACRAYRRLVALIKGPRSQTFAVDLFRVKGSKHRHAYRLFSELASSDAADGALELAGLAMPEEEPLPDIGASLEREDIFGLRDVRGVDDPPAAWQATWKESDRQFRVWMLCPADRVEAANGPGQETRGQAGRRVRYLDVIREGENLNSTFVVLHEPGGPGDSMPIWRAQRLRVPATAGPDAVALRIFAEWGTYHVFSDFDEPAEVAGIRFAGALGIVNQTPQGTRWMLASEASTFMTDGFGFEYTTPSWSGKIVAQTDRELTAELSCPPDWEPLPDDVTSYVLIGAQAEPPAGFPVRAVRERSIEVERFPLPAATHFHLPNVCFLEER